MKTLIFLKLKEVNSPGNKIRSSAHATANNRNLFVNNQTNTTQDLEFNSASQQVDASIMNQLKTTKIYLWY